MSGCVIMDEMMCQGMIVVKSYLIYLRMYAAAKRGQRYNNNHDKRPFNTMRPGNKQYQQLTMTAINDDSN